MREKSFENLTLVSLFALLAAIKVMGLWVYGPIMTPDSTGYSGFADIMLNSRAWLTSESLKGYGYPATSFRIIGYPALIALMKVIAGDAWAWLIVGFQFVLSLVASAYVFCLVKRISKSHGLALFALIAHGLGQALFLDQSILSDSLNASLLIILSCHMGLGILDRRRPSLLEVGALGSLVLAAFLLREAGNYLQFLYWPFIVYWGILLGEGRLRPVLMLIVFVAPMVLGTQAYKTWNESRTGRRFITTAAQTGMFFPTLDLEKRGVRVLSKDKLLKDMGPLLPFASATPLQNVRRISAHLANAHGLNALDIANYGMASFRRYWLAYPWDMVKITLSNLRGKQVRLAVMPIDAGVTLKLWATGKTLLPKKGEVWKAVVEHGRVDLLGLVVARRGFRLVSILISLAFVFGVLALFVREVVRKGVRVQAWDRTVTLLFLYWLLYFGYTSAYAMVSLEMRYLMPVEPLSMATGLIVIWWGMKNFKIRRAFKKTLQEKLE